MEVGSGKFFSFTPHMDEGFLLHCWKLPAPPYQMVHLVLSCNA